MNNSTYIESSNDSGCVVNCGRPLILTPEIFMSYNIYLVISSILGITGNGLVLAVFAKNKASTSTDWFIIFITIFDFISAVFNVPVYLTFTTGIWQIIGNDVFCKVHMFVSQSVALSSTFLICGLAMERYLKVCRTRMSIDKTWAFRMCIVISSITALLSTPCFMIFSNNRGQCDVKQSVKWWFTYYILFLVAYVLAFGVVAFSYINISLVALKSERTLSNHNDVTSTESNLIGSRRVHIYNNKVFPLSSTNVPPNQEGENVTANAANGSSTIQRHQNMTSETKFLPSPHTSYGNRLSMVSSSCDAVNVGVRRSNVQNTARGSNNIRPTGPSTRQNKVKRTTRLTCMICLVFIVSWIPPWVVFVLLSIPGMRAQPAALRFAMFGKMTYLLNTFMNPILYLILNHKFREQTARFICFWK